MLLRSILVEREPIYRQQETVRTFAPEMYALHPEGVDQVSDDRIGRALDRLFDADRAALLTEVVIAVAKHFEIRCDELHNDSTTIPFHGAVPPRPGPTDAGPARTAGSRCSSGAAMGTPTTR